MLALRGGHNGGQTRIAARLTKLGLAASEESLAFPHCFAVGPPGDPDMSDPHATPQALRSYQLSDNLAAESGWVLLRYTPQQLLKPETIAQIKKTLAARFK